MAVPKRKEIVEAVAATYTFDGSKQNAIEFCRRVVRILRKEDKRWGLNYKRGKLGDVSADIIAYADVNDGTRIIDILAAYDDPSEWPGEKPLILWHMHSKENAGAVKWFWDEADSVEKPEPKPEPPSPPPSPPDPRLDVIEAVLKTLVDAVQAQDTRIKELQEGLIKMQNQKLTLRAKGTTGRTFGHAHQVEIVLEEVK